MFSHSCEEKTQFYVRLAQLLVGGWGGGNSQRIATLVSNVHELSHTCSSFMISQTGWHVQHTCIHECMARPRLQWPAAVIVTMT